MKKYLILVLSMLVLSLPAYGSFGKLKQKRVVKGVHAQIENGELPQWVNRTIESIVDRAAEELIERGFNDEARDIMVEWYAEYSMHLMREDLGDHRPLSQWLSDLYDRLESLLGPTVMALLHLDDIKVVNYAIPVVFDPRMETGWWSDPFPKQEYGEHFIPLSGVITYWAVWAACSFSTSGVASFVICSPAGSWSEWLAKKYFAPGLSDRIYDRANRRPRIIKEE